MFFRRTFKKQFAPKKASIQANKQSTHMNLKPLIIIGFMQALSFPVYSQEANEKHKDAFCTVSQRKTELMLHFRFDRSIVDYGYRDNQQALAALHKLFADRNGAERIDSIRIRAFSSPEGNAAYNQRLALKRARAVKGYLVWKYPGIPQHRIRTSAQAESWEALREAIGNDTLLPCRDEILQILELNATESRKEALLKKLDAGIPYGYLRRQVLPQVRNASICTVYMGAEGKDTLPISAEGRDSLPISAERRDTLYMNAEGRDSSLTLRMTGKDKAEATGTSGADNAGVTDTCHSERSEESPLTGITDNTGITGITNNTNATNNTNITDIRHSERSEESPLTGITNNARIADNARITNNASIATHTRPLFALKTNLLFDAALMPNIELELPIGKRWSLNAEYIFPWWLINDDRYCLQLLMGGLEGRYWFGNREKRQALTGHFAGLYAGGGKYDLQWDTKGYQGEFFIAAGISYGYAHPIARNLRLEYNIGIGMLRTNYRHYHTRDNHRTLLWQENGEYTWLGPTKLKVSLVWLINRKTKK
ncbi:DUF3575 domain-containing protein [Bacteroides sp. AM10-21B]|nr:DUF3575 domain-containing protein [Bacteroides sp. AM10-21B]